jgi:hypothetical protein
MLRSILENLSPREFLEMLKEHISQKNTTPTVSFAETVNQVVPPYNKGNITENSVVVESSSDKESLDFESIPEEPTTTSPERGKKESGKFKLFGTKSKRKKELKSSSHPQSKPEINDDFTLKETYLPKNAESVAPQQQMQTELSEITESLPVVVQRVNLKCVGKSELPQLINVAVNVGDIFSIGRHDAAVGRPQSSFEFDKKTKAVSRRHAVIERDNEGYKIIDLSSRAGTFVDGKKLPPNTPYLLEAGTRVAFGNFGTDYIWDVSYHAPPA